MLNSVFLKHIMSTFVFNMKVQSILMFVLHRVSHTLFNTARKVFRPEINVDKKTEPFRNLCSFDVLKDLTSASSTYCT